MVRPTLFSWYPHLAPDENPSSWLVGVNLIAWKKIGILANQFLQ